MQLPLSIGRFLAIVFLLAACYLDAPHLALAQMPPAVSSPQTAQAPPAATQAVITNAQAKVKAGLFAEAVAELTAAQTPSMAASDKQAIDFTLSETEEAWGWKLNLQNQYIDEIPHIEHALTLDNHYPARRQWSATALLRLGIAYDNLGKYEDAVDFYTNARSAFHDANDNSGEARAISCLGLVSIELSRFDKAAVFLKQAADIFHKIPDIHSEAVALEGEGQAYVQLSQYEKAMKTYLMVLPIFQSMSDINGEARIYNHLGEVYFQTGQFEDSIAFLNKALPPLHRLQDNNGEASVLMNLGNCYNFLKHHEIAINYFEQAHELFYRASNWDGEAETLLNTGSAFLGLQQYEKAISYYQQALPVFQRLKQREHIAEALTCMSGAFLLTGRYEDAIGNSAEATLIFHQVKDSNGEAKALWMLENAWSNPSYIHANLDIAISFGKQAIGIIQSVRSRILGMDKHSQQSYIQQNEINYRNVANLLISQRRLPEALQVIDLLKEEEYINFNSYSLGVTKTLILTKVIDYTQRELRWLPQIVVAEDTLADDVGKQNELAYQKNPTTEQQQMMISLAQKVDTDVTIYRKTLSDSSADFPKQPDPVQDRLAITTNAQELEAALHALGSGTVALYTLATGQELRLLLVTPSKIVAHTAELKDANELDQKIVVFRALLQHPNLDPRSAGKALYDLLIAPIKADLDAAHAKTLLVSLDGNLRYIPLAALWDGSHYLAENYRTALYTPAALTNLTREPNPHWTALAMGAAAAPGFLPLPAVPGELQGIVHMTGDPATEGGLFPGRRLIDGAFTKSAMLTALGQGYPLVHIASHFVFTGDEAKSFLVLGDGSRLTLADLKALPDGIFSGVNLLTLSACETATGNLGVAGSGDPGAADAANGSRDVENIAVLAQRKGADAVLASLWSVNDASTGALMRQFYRDQQGSGKTNSGEQSKAEALRQAQIALLTGRDASGAPLVIDSRGELVNAPPSANSVAAQAVAAAAKFPQTGLPKFAHPFYWAPFILLGNVR